MKKMVLFLMLTAMSVLGGCFGNGQDSKQEEKVGRREVVLPVIYFRGTPNSWEKTEMKMVSENVWQTVVEFKTGDVNGGPRFKVTEGEDWTKTYPVKDYLITKGYGKYRVEFNYLTKAVTAKKVNENGIAYNYEKVYLRGTNNKWDKSEMSLVSDNKWEINSIFNEGDAKGGPRFKIDVTGDWKETYPITDYLITRGVGDYKIVFNDETKKIEVFKSNENGLYSKYEKVYLRGTNNKWDKTEMNLVSDNKWEVISVFNEGDAKGGPRFKIDVTGDWKESYPAIDFVVEKAMYKVIFDEITKTVTTEKIEEVKFTDGKIEKAVRMKLGNLTDVITKDDVMKITELSLANTGVTLLGDLIKLTQLKTLDLSENLISDITVLDNLAELKTVNLKNNKLGTDSLSVIVKLRNRGITVEDNTNYVNTVEDIKAMATAGVDFDIHVIGIYAGSNYGSYSNMGVEITDTSKPIVVILSAYDYMNWNIKVKEGVTLLKVVVGGYYSKKVTGVDSYIEKGYLGYYGLDYGLYLNLVDKVESDFGKKPKTVQSEYGATSFIVDGINTVDYSKEIAAENTVENVSKVVFLSDSVVWIEYVGAYGMSATYAGSGAATMTKTNAGINKGKWYGEFKFKARSGATSPATWTTLGIGTETAFYFWATTDGEFGYFTCIENRSYTNGDIIGLAVDYDNGKMFYSINGIWQNLTSGINVPKKGLKYYMAVSATGNGAGFDGKNDEWTAAFDRADLRYPIPEGYQPYGEIINIE